MKISTLFATTFMVHAASAGTVQEQCVLENEALCNGVDHDGSCFQCEEGSACVFVSPEESYCIPGYEDAPDYATCVVDDNKQCGGPGYAGCQNCGPQSQCVPNEEIFTCESNNDKSGEPVLQNEDVALVGGWMNGIDKDLDDMLAAGDESQELRGKLSQVYATVKGRNRCRKLAKTNTKFQEFDRSIESEKQSAWCQLASEPNSMVSSTTRDCLCNRGQKKSEPFLFCAASLEQEALHHQRRRALERKEKNRNLRQGIFNSTNGVRGQKRNLAAGCEVSGGGNIFSFANDLIDFLETGDVCVGVDCDVPLPPLPLTAELEANVCPFSIPTFIPPSLPPLVRYLVAMGTKAEIRAALCLGGNPAFDAIRDVLNFLGISLCFIEGDIAIKPVIGVVDASITFNFLNIFARGSYKTLFDEDIRDSLGLCEGPAGFFFSECIMCEGGSASSLEIGASFLFVTIKGQIAGFNTNC